MFGNAGREHMEKYGAYHCVVSTQVHFVTRQGPRKSTLRRLHTKITCTLLPTRTLRVLLPLTWQQFAIPRRLHVGADLVRSRSVRAPYDAAVLSDVRMLK